MKYSATNGRSHHCESGFTLLEMLLVVVIMGFFAALVGPGVFGFWQLRQINTAQQQTLQGIRTAQKHAIQTQSEWQFSIREINNQVSWAIHPRTMTASDYPVWQPLPEQVQLDDETTFATSGGIHYVRFGLQGQVTYRLGRVTFSSRSGGSIKRCVIVSTLIGATRLGKDHRYPDDGKYCY